MLPTLAVLPGVTLVLVGEPILTPSSNPALRGVNLEVVGEPTQQLQSIDTLNLFTKNKHCQFAMSAAGTENDWKHQQLTLPLVIVQCLC